MVIQKKSSEVWDTLGAVKTEFAKYAGVLAKVKKKLQEASHTVEHAETRTRVLQRRLRDVETGSSDSLEAANLPLDFEETDLSLPLESAASPATHVAPEFIPLSEGDAPGPV